MYIINQGWGPYQENYIGLDKVLTVCAESSEVRTVKIFGWYSHSIILGESLHE